MVRDRRAVPLAVAALVAVADRVSKWLVETRLGLYDSVPVVPGLFNIVRSENHGVAFGILDNGPSPLRTGILITLSVVAIAALAMMLWKAGRQDSGSVMAMALIFGGAVGNVYDRVIAGKVTDFLDFQAGTWHWYTFNLADTAICVGAGLIALSALRGK